MDKTWMNEIDAENLNEKYKEVFILYKKIGMTQKMVAEELGCTRQNISLILNSIKNKESKAEKPKTEKLKRTTASENYQQYKSADLSILTDREKEILIMKMEGKTYKEIAERLETSTSSVGSLLCRAKTKLEGKETYEQRNRELVNARRRTPEHREKEKKWHRNFMNNHPEFKEHLKAYRREYYLKNRERIIEKVKKKRRKKEK